MKIKLVSLMLILLVIPTVNAGVGIVYGNEYVRAKEDGITCVSYGVYNPWENDANVRVYTGGNLTGITQNMTKIEIPGNTMHDQAIQAQICFEVPKIYEEECLFWKIGCRRDCSEEDVEYTGEVIASEVLESNRGGTGSRVTGAVTAPLTVRVPCEQKGTDIISIVGLVGLIAFVVLSVLIWNNYRAPPSERRRKKAERLEKKRERLERKLRQI